MYPVIIRRVADLRVGDRLIAHSGERYLHPLLVVGQTAYGVQVQEEHPGAGEPIDLVLHSWETDGQVLEVDRPTWRTTTTIPRRAA